MALREPRRWPKNWLVWLQCICLPKIGPYVWITAFAKPKLTTFLKAGLFLEYFGNKVSLNYHDTDCWTIKSTLFYGAQVGTAPHSLVGWDAAHWDVRLVSYMIDKEYRRGPQKLSRRPLCCKLRPVTHNIRQKLQTQTTMPNDNVARVNFQLSRTDFTMQFERRLVIQYWMRRRKARQALGRLNLMTWLAYMTWSLTATKR